MGKNAKPPIKFPRLRDYPKRVWIDDEPWTIEFPEVVQYEGRTVRGMTIFCNHLIQVKRHLRPHDRLETFIHELLHAVQHVHELKLSHDDIYDLESIIVDLMIDNWPWIFTALRSLRRSSL